MAEHTLTIYSGDRRIGSLILEEDRFRVEYDESWANSEQAFPLSPPLSWEAFKKQSPEAWTAGCRRFLVNLLPEGQQVDDILAAHSVRKGDVFSLLRILGRETAGALSFLPDGQVPAAPDDGHQRVVPADELSARIRELDLRGIDPGARTLAIWDGKARLSAIAGVQEKLPVRLEKGVVSLVDGGLASTHILKPESSRLPGIVANEAFCMRLARFVGIETARVSVLKVPEPVLVVERFDRVRTERGVERLHIVDACQALDRAAEYKYERNFGSGADVAHIRDGVSLPLMFSLCRRGIGTVPAPMRLALTRRVIFNHFIGNSDAHGKNFSFFVTPAGLWLAPAYDLVSAAVYPDLAQDSAMAIGSTFDPESVSADDWKEMAVDCGLPQALVQKELQAMAKKLTGLPDAVRAAGDGVAVLGGKKLEIDQDVGVREIVESISRVIESRTAPYR